MGLRCLVSSADSSKNFELRCHVRERLIAYIQKDYPESLARVRTELGQVGSAAEQRTRQSVAPQRRETKERRRERDHHRVTNPSSNESRFYKAGRRLLMQPRDSTSKPGQCRFELFRVMQLVPQGFHDQTDQSIRNGIRR